MQRFVLIVTHSDDNESVKKISDEIASKGLSPFRLDTDLYPEKYLLNSVFNASGSTYHLTGPNNQYLSSHEILSVWYRRFAPAGKVDHSMGSQLRSVCIEESKHTLLGFLNNLDCFKIDDYWHIRRASNKEYQLKIAQKLGFIIPNTLTTNNATKAKDFFERNKKDIVTKMQSQFSIWKENQEQVLFTSKITEQHISNMDGLEKCPMIFQSNIKKKLELRATIVGDKIFCAAIDSNAHDNMNVDWRIRGLDTLDFWFKYDLPQYMQEKLLKLTKALGLHYGAVDLILTAKDEYVFLEINPSGEFYWMDQYTKLDICQALANKLVVAH